jgi:16S rRNA (guanine(966)-N(2))-methyltransferase RsmD
LRLTGGQGRGRRLASAAIRGLRPTSSRVREALFDILGARVEGADILDLFAGSGAVGIEALSRGARRAVFVEAQRRAARLIEANLRAAAVRGSTQVLADGAAAALDRLARAGDSFSIVFLDPPYAIGASPGLLECAARVLRAGGVLVVEHGARALPEPPAHVPLVAGRRYRYGDSRLSVFHRVPDAGESRG